MAHSVHITFHSNQVNFLWTDGRTLGPLWEEST